MTSSTSALLISVAAGLLIGLAIWVLTRRRASFVDRIQTYVQPDVAQGDHARSLIERALGDRQAEQIAKSPFITRLRTELDVAQVNLTPEQIIPLVLLLTVLIGWLMAHETGSPLGALLGLAVPGLAYLGVNIKAGKERRAFSEQLPDNLQVVSSSMRAGQTLVGSLKACVDDAPEPSRRELKRVVTDEAIGVPLPEALDRVTQRMKSEDFRHLAIVATLQRETGGNTAEIIDLVASTIRERIEIRRMVSSLTAQGRLSGGMLSMLPVGLLMIISVMNPGYIHPLFHTTVGIVLLVVAFVLVALGAFIMNRLIQIKV